ncbi:hypothetical protein KM043_007210 [Ampulex compressa]|nr:hypothetical protein KM043_007210 [Ampulex compressa]
MSPGMSHKNLIQRDIYEGANEQSLCVHLHIRCASALLSVVDDILKNSEFRCFNSLKICVYLIRDVQPHDRDYAITWDFCEDKGTIVEKTIFNLINKHGQPYDFCLCIGG